MGEVFVTKKSNTNSTKASETKITRIKASDSDNNKKNNFKDKLSNLKAKVKKAKSKKNITNPEESNFKDNVYQKEIKKVGYFRGALNELSQVHWPTRKETWALTLAVILFSVGFMILMILVDIGFKELFNIIMKR
jgi:preprotein translocase, secE subunit